MESDEDDEDDDQKDGDQKDGENKKIKREAEDRPRRILKIEPVDDDFVVNLDDDELSPFPIYPYIYNVSISVDDYLLKLLSLYE